MIVLHAFYLVHETKEEDKNVINISETSDNVKMNKHAYPGEHCQVPVTAVMFCQTIYLGTMTITRLRIFYHIYTVIYNRYVNMLCLM